MKTFLPLLMFIICLAANAQNTVFVDEWKSHKVTTDLDSLNIYAQDKTDWMVYSSEGKIAVKPELKANERKLPFVLPPARFGTKKYSGLKAFIEVSDGFLVSFTGGEYGDKISWYSKNGQESYFIAKVVVLDFIKRDDKIYAIEATEKGSVIEVKKQGEKWVSAESVKLPYLPEAIGIDNNKNFIVATSDNLIQVAPDGTIKTLIAEGFWSILYPNSLVVKGDDIYVGMRKGVFKYNRVTKKQEWLMND